MMSKFKAELQNDCRKFVETFRPQDDPDLVALRMMQAAVREFYQLEAQRMLEEAASALHGFCQLYDPHDGTANRIANESAELLSILRSK